MKHDTPRPGAKNPSAAPRRRTNSVTVKVKGTSANDCEVVVSFPETAQRDWDDCDDTTKDEQVASSTRDELAAAIDDIRRTLETRLEQENARLAYTNEVLERRNRALEDELARKGDDLERQPGHTRRHETVRPNRHTTTNVPPPQLAECMLMTFKIKITELDADRIKITLPGSDRCPTPTVLSPSRSHMLWPILEAYAHRHSHSPLVFVLGDGVMVDRNATIAQIGIRDRSSVILVAPVDLVGVNKVEGLTSTRDINWHGGHGRRSFQ